MALFGSNKSSIDDLEPKKSDYVEKIADERIRKNEVSKLIRYREMEQFHHEKTQNEQISDLKAELAKKDKEIEELKEEIRAMRGKVGGVGVAGRQING
ncbi:hypothetical protein KKP97_05285 [Methanothermococcus sp. SCGC AD-155-C09]|nr:hypothetical protein [Methanothermococcus sp. SCGC AD-155-C09]